MAIKKTEFYLSLWTSCEELRGGMNVSQMQELSTGKTRLPFDSFLLKN